MYRTKKIVSREQMNVAEYEVIGTHIDWTIPINHTTPRRRPERASETPKLWVPLRRLTRQISRFQGRVYLPSNYNDGDSNPNA